MNLAPGAERILAMRRAGQRPGSDVVISLVGHLPVECLIEADLDTEYDWVMLVDLNVWIVATTKTSPSKLRDLLWSFRRHRPARMYLWLDDRHVGYSMHFAPKIDTITRPPDRWEWEMERARLLRWENECMRQLFAGVEV